MPKIAIIGSGISGMGVAYLLNKTHNITVYEKEQHIGGHSLTLDVATPQDGAVAVDIGFIVFNQRNYPNLTALFRHLNVPIAKSNMSFGASIDNGWMEYGTQHLSNVLAQKRNLLRPNFYRLLGDIFRFNQQAKTFVTTNPSASMAQCLDALGMGQWFKHYYLLAMGGAIWSTPLKQMLHFPASTMVRFFENHGLLSVSGQPQWYTVQGGSREYVARLTASFQHKIRKNCPVARVQRQASGVAVSDTQGNTETYDQVIFACHSDQALTLIENPTQNEQKILGDIHYQPNRVVLHSDIRFMPKRKKAWASWVYLCEGREDTQKEVSLSYWMNSLQPLGSDYPVLVTLNPTKEPDPTLVHHEHTFEHPLFNQAAITAQAKIEQIQGVDRLWFCGAWQRYGFHEDGLSSAVAIADKLGVTVPWH